MRGRQILLVLFVPENFGHVISSILCASHLKDVKKTKYIVLYLVKVAPRDEWIQIFYLKQYIRRQPNRVVSSLAASRTKLHKEQCCGQS